RTGEGQGRDAPEETEGNERKRDETGGLRDRRRETGGTGGEPAEGPVRNRRRSAAFVVPARQFLKGGVLGQEGQFHGAGASVAVLAEDEFGNAPARVVR